MVPKRHKLKRSLTLKTMTEEPDCYADNKRESKGSKKGYKRGEKEWVEVKARSLQYTVRSTLRGKREGIGDRERRIGRSSRMTIISWVYVGGHEGWRPRGGRVPLPAF